MTRAAEALVALGVREDATQAEVKAAYRALAQTLHPDKAGDDPEALGRFQKLQTNYALAMAQAPTARACGVCKGAGRVKRRRGFFAVDASCGACRGTGEERPA